VTTTPMRLALARVSVLTGSREVTRRLRPLIGWAIVERDDDDRVQRP
jgi:hypothetical protein